MREPRTLPWVRILCGGPWEAGGEGKSITTVSQLVKVQS